MRQDYHRKLPKRAVPHQSYVQKNIKLSIIISVQSIYYMLMYVVTKLFNHTNFDCSQYVVVLHLGICLTCHPLIPENCWAERRRIKVNNFGETLMNQQPPPDGPQGGRRPPPIPEDAGRALLAKSRDLLPVVRDKWDVAMQEGGAALQAQANRPDWAGTAEQIWEQSYGQKFFWA